MARDIERMLFDTISPPPVQVAEEGLPEPNSPLGTHSVPCFLQSLTSRTRGLTSGLYPATWGQVRPFLCSVLRVGDQ